MREADGLALSSRNRYLSTIDRTRALAIPRSLSEAARSFDDGERSVAALRALVLAPLEDALDRVDYVTIADADDVGVLADDVTVDDRAVLAVAARVGTTRLIDNLVLGEDPAPLQP